MKPTTLKSYVPESERIDQKHLDAARQGIEDFAAVSAEGYRILAYRGRSGRARRTLPSLWKLPKSELAFWEQSASRSRRALLLSEKEPVLLFGDLMDVTGVLFAARLPIPVSKLLGALRYIKRTDVAVSPAILACRPEPSLPCEEICEDISRIFYYLDRILDTEANFRIGLWSRMLLIAEFVGCRLDETALSINPPAISKGDTARLTVFLLCAMLRLRQMDGRVRAKNGEQPHFFCRVELERADKEQAREQDAPSEFPFLSLPSFSDFSIYTEQEHLVLEALLQSTDRVGVLHAHHAPPIRLRLLFG